MIHSTFTEDLRRFAVTAFNDCWKLIDLPERTAGEDREMIRLAEVSYWHWLQFDGHTPENEGIGLWQLSRVYALAGEAGRALAFAGEYRQLCDTAELGAFHEGFSHEALARGHFVTGDITAAREALASARQQAVLVEDPSSRKLLEADLVQLGNALDP
jgi:hypothetical protein